LQSAALLKARLLGAGEPLQAMDDPSVGCETQKYVTQSYREKFE